MINARDPLSRGKLFWYVDVKHQARQCGDKVRHSKNSAIRAAAAMKEKTGDYFTVYECLYCKRWHVGNSK